MRALSLWQPWASLIAIGAKRYETRSYATGIRGELAIHAAKKKDPDCLDLCLEEPFASALVEGGIGCSAELPFGAVIARVKVIGCHRVEDIRDQLSDQERAFGDFRDGRFAWEMELIAKFKEPIPARGAQGFWFWKPLAPSVLK